MQFPSSLHWCDHIVPTLDNGCWNVTNDVNVIEKVVVVREPATMDKIVTRGKKGGRGREREGE